MSSAGSYRPEAWAYVDPHGLRTGVAVTSSAGSHPANGSNNNNSSSNNNSGSDHGIPIRCTNGDVYYDRCTAAQPDECTRAPQTPRARWSPAQPSMLYDQGQPGTPDMAVIIERLLDDLEREREARARAESRPAAAVATTSSSSITTLPPAPTAHVDLNAVAGTAPMPQSGLQQMPPAAPPQYVYLSGSPPAPAIAPVGAVSGGSPTLVGSGAPGSAGSASPGAVSPPPGTTSNRTLLLALIPILIVMLLFGAWIVWRLSTIERRLTAVAAHAASIAPPPPLVSPVVSPVATTQTTPAPRPGGVLAVDTNNQYYYARPIAP
jgi:hypothetical protein